MNGIDFSCIEKYQQKLEELGKKGDKLEGKAISAGAEIILKEMQKTSSFSDITGKLRRGLKISKPSKLRGVRVVKVGIQKDDNSEVFYGKFIEFGTSTGNVARPFMRPAFENKRSEALQKTKEVIRAGLGL